MDVADIRSRIQAILLIDTTNEIIALMGKLEVPPLQSMLMLATLVVSLPIWNSNPIVSKLVYLLASTLVAIFISETNSLLGNDGELGDVFMYTLMATTIVAVLKSLPKHVTGSLLLSRIRFSLIYASARHIERMVLQQVWVAILTCIFGAALFVLRDLVYPRPLKPPIILNSFLKIMRQVLLNTSVAVLIDQTNGSIIQDVTYCLGVVIIVSFVVTLSKKQGWRGYALWRVGDIIMVDLRKSHGADEYTLAIVNWVLYYFASTVWTSEETNVYIDLLQLLSGSTITRALLAATEAMPLIDLLTIRFFIVLLFL